jgi:very-short-patch-repair endonuclease
VGRRRRLHALPRPGGPERRIAIEADGRSAHDGPDALHQDRFRQNVLKLAGWVVLRFTWADVLRRPGYVVATVRGALLRTS